MVAVEAETKIGWRKLVGIGGGSSGRGGGWCWVITRLNGERSKMAAAEQGGDEVGYRGWELAAVAERWKPAAGGAVVARQRRLVWWRGCGEMSKTTRNKTRSKPATQLD